MWFSVIFLEKTWIFTRMFDCRRPNSACGSVILGKTPLPGLFRFCGLGFSERHFAVFKHTFIPVLWKNGSVKNLL